MIQIEQMSKASKGFDAGAGWARGSASLDTVPETYPDPTPDAASESTDSETAADPDRPRSATADTLVQEAMLGGRADRADESTDEYDTFGVVGLRPE